VVPRFFFGAMSPYSWFAAERIEALLPGAAWQPVFAGALFKANRRSSWGLDDRRKAGLADCQARARVHGLGTILWPDPWPTNDVLVARAMTHAARRGLLMPFALAAMRMAFREGADLGDPVRVGEAGERVGIAAGELAAAVEDPAIKQALRSTNEQAVSLGVFGVPTVIVDGELFWGDDRLEAAADVWRGSTSPPSSPI
jgi:2-hydroxychromene-2-carboxylate isomerase